MKLLCCILDKSHILDEMKRLAVIKIQTAFRKYRNSLINEAISRTDQYIDKIAEPQKVIQELIKHHHHLRRIRITQKNSISEFE